VSSLHRLEGRAVLEDDSGMQVPNQGTENDPKCMAIATCPSICLHLCVCCVCVWGGGCILEDDKKMTTTHGTSKASQLSSMHRMEEGNVLEDSGLLVPNHQGFENDPNFLVHGYCNVSFHPTRSLRERRGS